MAANDTVFPPVAKLFWIKKHKPTNVGRIALERQATQSNSGAVV